MCEGGGLNCIQHMRFCATRVVQIFYVEWCFLKIENKPPVETGHIRSLSFEGSIVYHLTNTDDNETGEGCPTEIIKEPVGVIRHGKEHRLCNIAQLLLGAGGLTGTFN